MRIAAALSILVFFCAAAFLLFMSWKIPVHNYQLYVLQKHFRHTMQPIHPPQSTLIAEMAEFGNFGNSNHCDYLVGEFRSSALPREEVQKAYGEVKVLSFDGVSHLPLEIYFAETLREAAEHDYYWQSWLETYLPAQKHALYQDTYFVSVASDMHSPDGDLRCH